MLPHVTTPFKDIYLSRNMMAWLAWPPFQQLFRTSYGHNVLLAGSSQMKRLFQRAIMIYHVGGIFQHILNAQFHDQFEKSDQSHQCPAFIHCILHSWSVVDTCEYFRKPYRKKTLSRVKMVHDVSHKVHQETKCLRATRLKNYLFQLSGGNLLWGGRTKPGKERWDIMRHQLGVKISNLAEADNCGLCASWINGQIFDIGARY